LIITSKAAILDSDQLINRIGQNFKPRPTYFMNLEEPVRRHLRAIGYLTSFLVFTSCQSTENDRGVGETKAQSAPIILELAQDSFLKVRVAQEVDLLAAEKCALPQGTKLILASNPKESGASHIEVSIVGGLPDNCSKKEFTKGHVFEPHVLDQSRKILEVPYFCQMKNTVGKPSATCNNTALAMVAAYHGKASLSGSGSLPDQIFSRFGKPDSSEKIMLAAQKMGFMSEIKIPGSMEIIKSEIRAGRPVIVGADFVGEVGHFIVITGFNSEGFIVNDPYGKWDEVTISPADGYIQCHRPSGSGKGLHYSYKAMKKAAGSLGLYLVLIRK
jgi:hypothetical protein